MKATAPAERFYVAPLVGHRAASKGGRREPGMTAHVIDRLNCRKVVALFRSEDYCANLSSPEGRRARALHLAELEAARLNRMHVHSERQPARRQ